MTDHLTYFDLREYLDVLDMLYPTQRLPAQVDAAYKQGMITPREKKFLLTGE